MPLPFLSLVRSTRTLGQPPDKGGEKVRDLHKGVVLKFKRKVGQSADMKRTLLEASKAGIRRPESKIENMKAHEITSKC